MELRGQLVSPERFEGIVREHSPAVFRTLTRLTGPAAPVEDLAQEVFLRLYRALPEFRGEAALSTYLYRITVNVAHDEWKRRRRERERIAPEPLMEDEEAGAWLENQPGDPALLEHARSPEQLLADSEAQVRLSEAVDAGLLLLPEAERAVLVLFHTEELTYEAIATTLNLPIGTVRTHLHRGRKRLAALVRDRLPETGPARRVATPKAASQPSRLFSERTFSRNAKELLPWT